MNANQTETRYFKVADTLRREIASGALKPGDRLPSFPIMRAQGVSQNTVERAHTILEREGLIVREAKRGVFVAEPVRRKALGVIGVVSDYISKNHPYYANLLAGVQDAAHRNGLEVLLMQEISAVSRDKVDGVLVQGIDTLTSQFPLGLPRVSMLIDSPDMPSVTTDDCQGIRDAVDFLLWQGHRRIGYLNAYSTNELSRRRNHAYLEALRRADVSFEQDWAKDLESWEIQPETGGLRAQGRRKMNEWLQQGWASLGCTAVLAQNDDTAIGMIEALQEAGYRVPQDVSIIGFDGVERVDYSGPRLTTIQIPLESISRCSVNLLADIVKRHLEDAAEPHGTVNSVILPTSLRIGDSTGPASGDQG